MNVTAYIKTRKVGGSIVVTIPKEVVELAGIEEKKTIRLKIEKPRTGYFGAQKKIGRSNHKKRVNHRY